MSSKKNQPAETSIEETAEVRLDGPAVKENSISAEVLVQTIEGIQQLAFIFGAALEGIEINQRFKPSADLRQKFTLKCKVPAAGSYVLPMSIPLPSNVSTDEGALKKIFDLLSALENDKRQKLSELLPDSILRDRALTYLRSLLPKPGEEWSLGFKTAGKSITATSDFSGKVSSWIEQAADENTTMTVKGELVRIDFQANTVIIRYRPTNRDLKCIYRPEVEETLLKSRRDLIEVTGQFALDSAEHPKRMTDVFRIEPVDLSPLHLTKVTWQNRTFQFNEPLTFSTSLDEETQQLYVLTKPELAIDVFAETREQLVQELSEQIAFLWDTYAMESDNRLTPEAQLVAQQLRSMISTPRSPDA